MTAEQYRERGYNVSRNIAQGIIDAAEDLCYRAYISPISTADDDADASENKALAALAFLYVLQSQGVFATRSGAKTATIESGADAGRENIMHAAFARASFELTDFAKRHGVQADRVCSDVCGVFFRTNFLYI